MTRNVALAASAPKLRAIPKVEQKAWTATELQAFLRAAAGHRLFPALWLSANTGIRRNELLGLRWADLDIDHARLSINRGLVAVGYELHESRGKTSKARRCIDLDQTTLEVLAGWRALQSAEYSAIGIDDPGWMFTTATGEGVHPHSISQTFDRIVRRAPVPVIRLHDLRHTHGSLLIASGVNAKVVSERLGHAQFVFTVETYQHTFPPMHTDAARVFEALLTPDAGENPRSRKPVEHPAEHPPKPVERPDNDESPGQRPGLSRSSWWRGQCDGSGHRQGDESGHRQDGPVSVAGCRSVVRSSCRSRSRAVPRLRPHACTTCIGFCQSVGTRGPGLATLSTPAT
ncbi:MAG: site-specific integrase [Microthrixaceae bacterium]